MKRNAQNPGGEIETRPTMKGCEFGMKKGKGTDVGGTLVTKYSTNSPGMQGMGKSAHHTPGRKGAHANTSFAGDFITATSKANRQ